MSYTDVVIILISSLSNQLINSIYHPRIVHLVSVFFWQTFVKFLMKVYQKIIKRLSNVEQNLNKMDSANLLTINRKQHFSRARVREEKNREEKKHLQIEIVVAKKRWRMSASKQLGRIGVHEEWLL